MTFFHAKYFGKCANCGERIEPGDLVRYDDTIVHDECDGPLTIDDGPLDVCPECWLIRPCECEVAS